MSRTAAVVDLPQTSEGRAWWFLDTLVVEHLTASGTGPVVLEMTLPAGARQLPPPTGGPGRKELSRALAEHDVTVAGSSLSNGRRRPSRRSTASQP
jgi:hypothetical protein